MRVQTLVMGLLQAALLTACERQPTVSDSPSTSIDAAHNEAGTAERKAGALSLGTVGDREVAAAAPAPAQDWSRWSLPDLAANGRRLEERLVELLRTRTGKLQDVLSVERELARVREEIERMEGRLRYLRSSAQLSTLSVSLHEPIPIVASHGPGPITEAFRAAWRNFVGVLAGAIASLGFVVPVLGGGWAVLAMGRRWRQGVKAGTA